MTKLDPIIQNQDLLERLEGIKRRVGDMCSRHHGPRMSIPPNFNDDDVFIHVTINDTIKLIENFYRDETNKLLNLQNKFVEEMSLKLIQKLNQGKRG